MKYYFWLIFLFISPLFLTAKTLVVYHTSDAHGFYYPDASGRGGYAALASVLNKEENPYLLLDSGDFSNGTQEAASSKGLYSVETINRLGYDALTLGNHEYYFGPGPLAEMLARLQVPVVAANLKDLNGQTPTGIRPFHLLEKDGIKIAVIGLASNEIRGGVHTAQDCLGSLEKTLYEIYEAEPCFGEDALSQAFCRQATQKMRPDLVVVLAHHSLLGNSSYGAECLAQIPTRLKNKVHLVLGGHAHQRFDVAQRGAVYFAESGHGLKGVSRIELDLDEQSGKVLFAKSRFIELKVKKVGEDPAVKEWLETIRFKGLDEKIGVAHQALTHQIKPGVKDSSLGNWAADLIRAYAQSDIAVHNNAALRKEINKGPLSRRDIAELYPYQNRIYTFMVSGRFIKTLLRQDIERAVASFAYSGVKAVYHQNEKGEITQEKIWVQGQPLQEDKMYRLATIDFLALGKGEGNVFSQIPLEEKHLAGDKEVALLMQEAFARGLYAPRSGRLRLKK